MLTTIENMIMNAVTTFISNTFDSILGLFISFLGDEMAVAIKILNTPYITNAIYFTKLVAGTLLGVKVAAEAFKTYILYSSGDSSARPFELVKRTAFAALMVSAGPWAVNRIYEWGSEFAKAIASLPSTQAGNPVIWTQNILSLSLSSTIAMILIAFTVLIVWILILIQTGIRAVEIAFLAVSAPIMAVGLTRPDEGVWTVWWRELIVLSLSQAVQTFMIRGFLSTEVNMQFNSSVLSLLMLIGWLWVAFKTPSVLRQFAYHTGMGSAVGQAGQSAGSMYILRKAILKG
ncbi:MULTISPECIES: conjugal transfer protein TrbL family protein [Thermoanaerobacterium]|uniref:conjugal transfer protein TrbL family protein n=1 Tax=Thermoanaerobacterium TaxID=28895 RepID=UPI0002D8B5C7|nr:MULTISPECIES: conjugal transfer protein TrbL family protein [Thermoanaerobacterium]